MKDSESTLHRMGGGGPRPPSFQAALGRNTLRRQCPATTRGCLIVRIIHPRARRLINSTVGLVRVHSCKNFRAVSATARAPAFERSKPSVSFRIDPPTAAHLEAANQATASPVRPRPSWTRTRPPRFRASLRRGGRPTGQNPLARAALKGRGSPREAT